MMLAFLANLQEAAADAYRKASMRTAKYFSSAKTTDNASIPQVTKNTDPNCAPTRTCESALLVKRFQLLRSLG